MRQDMFKVIVERSRRRNGAGPGHYYRAAKHFVLDEDLEVTDEFIGRKLPQRRGQYRRLNENLNPLYRFLISRVGSPWDDVYSEICENLDTGSTVKQHVRDHLEDFIETKTYLEDGVVYYCDRWGDYNRVDTYHHRHWTASQTLYVHPVTKLITLSQCIGEHPHAAERRRIEELQASRKVYVNKFLRFEKQKNKRDQWVWFRQVYVKVASDREIFEKHVWPNLKLQIERNENRLYKGGSKDKTCVHFPDDRKFFVHATDPFLEHNGAVRARAWRGTHAPDGVVLLKTEAASKQDIKRYQLNG